MKKIPSKKEITSVYYNQNKTMKECCEVFGIKSPITFKKWMDHYGLEAKDTNYLRSLEYKLGITEGELHRKIERMYHVEGKSLNKIAKELNTTTTTISKKMKRAGIEKYDSMKAKTVFGSGEKSGSWKGGRYISSHGYVVIMDKEHPNQIKEGYVYEHRSVMEKHLGRYLRADEVVHHINQNKQDNRIENLQLMTNSEHASLHGRLERGV